MNIDTLRRLYKDSLADSHDAALRALHRLGFNEGVLAAGLQVPPGPPVVEVSHVPMRASDVRDGGDTPLTPLQAATILAFTPKPKT